MIKFFLSFLADTHPTLPHAFSSHTHLLLLLPNNWALHLWKVSVGCRTRIRSTLCTLMLLLTFHSPLPCTQQMGLISETSPRGACLLVSSPSPANAFTQVFIPTWSSIRNNMKYHLTVDAPRGTRQGKEMEGNSSCRGINLSVGVCLWLEIFRNHNRNPITINETFYHSRWTRNSGRNEMKILLHSHSTSL